MNVPSRSKVTAILLALSRHHFNYINNTSAFYSSTKRLCLNPDGFRPTLLGNECFPIRQLAVPYHTLHRAPRQHPRLLEAERDYDQHALRHKSKKKQHDSDDDSDSDIDDKLDEDDFEAPNQFKVQTIHAPSLRIDAILSKALGLSRHRLEEIFFGPGILLNGKKMLKKGGKMDVGDYVDAVMERGDEQIRVKRVKLLKVGSEKTSTDKLILKVRIWKSPFLIDNPDQWKPDS